MATKQQKAAQGRSGTGEAEVPGKADNGGLGLDKPGVKVVETPPVETRGKIFAGFKPSDVKLKGKITRLDH